MQAVLRVEKQKSNRLYPAAAAGNRRRVRFSRKTAVGKIGRRAADSGQAADLQAFRGKTNGLSIDRSVGIDKTSPHILPATRIRGGPEKGALNSTNSRDVQRNVTFRDSVRFGSDGGGDDSCPPVVRVTDSERAELCSFWLTRDGYYAWTRVEGDGQ